MPKAIRTFMAQFALEPDDACTCNVSRIKLDTVGRLIPACGIVSAIIPPVTKWWWVGHQTRCASREPPLLKKER